MPNVSYDTLTITINADSKQANANISRLSNNLQKLDETLKKVDTKRIEQVRKLLQNIANIDFTNVSQGLADVVSAFKMFNKYSAKDGVGAMLGNLDFSSLSEEAQTEINDLILKWTELKGAEIGEAEAIKEDTSALQDHTDALKKAKKSSDEFGKTLKKLANDFARILKYRILRKIIQDIYKAFVEGAKNIIAFDDQTAQAFNDVMNSAKYLVNSLGALFAPLLQMVAPILVSLTDMFADATNGLAELFASANGQNMFASATKGAEDYTKALKKTQSIGIDELNVIGQDKNLFNFEMKPVDDEVEGLGAIKELLTEIGALVKDVFKTITPILKPILKLVSAILQSFVPAIKTIQQVWNILAPTILDIVAEIIDFLADIFPIITKINEILSPLIVALAQFINGAFSMLKDWIIKLRPVIEAIVNIVAGILVGALGAVVDIVSWLIKGITTVFLVLQGIAETAVKIISFDWGKIGQVWGKIGGRISDVWSNSDWNTVSYATGGFPKEDGLFFANHNELVGQFSNGQTAVANNQQITEGIYQAVLQAMRESGGGNGEVVINLDGYEMARVITKRQNNFGQNLVVGGNINYGK